MRQFFALCILLSTAWGTNAQSLLGVESVEYDAVNDRYLASSDGTSIVAIAPNGGLSYFGSGLAADYGMEIAGNTLFAISGTHIKGYDLTTATMVMDLNLPGAVFLNGLATNGTDRLWASDFSGYDIYEVDITSLSSPTFSMVADQIDLGTTNRPNGIVHDAANNRIVFVNWGAAPIKAMDLSTYVVSTLVPNTNLTNIDGIDRDGQGNWYVASWTPARITRYTNDFSSSEIITVPGISSPADICYANETDTLAIPGGDQVLFVGFESSVVGIGNSASNTKMFIQYADGQPMVRFSLRQAQELSLDIVDMGGRTVYTALEGAQPEGAHTVVLGAIGLESGTYVCRITSKELNAAEQVVIP